MLFSNSTRPAMAAIVTLVLAPGAGAAQILAIGQPAPFRTWTGYEVGMNPSAVAAADFDGDGDPDVAYGRHAFFENTLVVQMNSGRGSMGPATNLPAVEQTNDVAAADLNGDGRPDLVAISEGLTYTNNIIDIYLNAGDGTFSHTTDVGGIGPARFVVADLNGDGHLDLALANGNIVNQGNTVGVLLGNGDGTFGAETRYPAGTGVFGIATADLDGDGRLDLAVGRSTGTEAAWHVTLLRNTGTAFTNQRDFTIPGDPQFVPGQPVVAAADLDGDGRTDLVAGAGGHPRLALLRNSGSWNFSVTLTPADFGRSNILARDFDGDGDVDVVEAAPSGGTQSTGELALLRGNGDGTLAAPIFFNQGFYPNDVAAADFSGDGRLDLAVANMLSNTGSIDPQLPNGRFAGAPVYQALPDQIPFDTASADFDGDGLIDMALATIDVASLGRDRVAIMHNTGGGRMQLTAALRTGTDSHAKSVIAADLNDDGHLDLAWTPEFFIRPGTYPVAFALNRGDGTFAATTTIFIQTCGTGHVSAIDVNGDGPLDLVVANDRSGPSLFCDQVSRTIRILINNGDATFQPDYEVFIGSSSSQVAGADLDADGILDLVDTDAITHVLFGTGGGQFAPTVDYAARGNELVIVDFDHDGDPDVATADGSFADMYVMLNDGDGGFIQTTKYPGEKIIGYLTGNSIAAGDLNEDGFTDLAVSDAQGQDVGVYYGRADGKFRPQVRYGVQYDGVDVNIADYDGDGHLDIGGPSGIGGALTSGREGVTTLINQTP